MANSLKFTVSEWIRIYLIGPLITVGHAIFNQIRDDDANESLITISGTKTSANYLRGIDLTLTHASTGALRGFSSFTTASSSGLNFAAHLRAAGNATAYQQSIALLAQLVQKSASSTPRSCVIYMETAESTQTPFASIIDDGANVNEHGILLNGTYNTGAIVTLRGDWINSAGAPADNTANDSPKLVLRGRTDTDAGAGITDTAVSPYIKTVLSAAPAITHNVSIFDSADLELIRANSSTRGIVLKCPAAAPADADVFTSGVSFSVNEAGNALTFKVKYADGVTVKSGTVALT